MSLVVEDALTPAVEAPPVRYGSWGARAGALALDVLPGVAVLATFALLVVTTRPGSWLRWACVVAMALVVAAMVANRVVLPAVTGWTLGRSVFGIRVVHRDGTSPGILRLVLRDLAHLLDTAAVFIGWAWPLWDGSNRTFADMLVHTRVRVVEPAQRPVRRIAAWVLVGATLLCALSTALGYGVVYRHDKAVDAARAQISEQGPRIVEKMLSYTTETVVDDFAQAQALATDGYRQQIIDQQQRIQQAGVISNEFWAVSSAVLSVEPDRAAMLLALQGQRGANVNDLKFITATVRADFVRVGGDWRMDSLTVLKKPLIQGPPTAAAPPAPAPPAPAPAPPKPSPPKAPGQGSR